MDDYQLKISHVLREDVSEIFISTSKAHLWSTVPQRILCKMLEIDSPEFAHLPYLVNDKARRIGKE